MIDALSLSFCVRFGCVRIKKKLTSTTVGTIFLFVLVYYYFILFYFVVCAPPQLFFLVSCFLVATKYFITFLLCFVYY